ncbi:hypothetical protein [Sulfitobacter alexandrii]|nr:hypothetical protein [Sulfitobacter alexandrii]
MLLRIVPYLAVAITLAALLLSPALRPHDIDGLNAPAHHYSGLF